VIRSREGFISGWKRNLEMLTLKELEVLKEIIELDIKEGKND
jgi:hypothetical protein